MRRGNNAEHTPYLPNPLSTSPGLPKSDIWVLEFVRSLRASGPAMFADSFRSQCTAPLHCACLISSLTEFLKQNASSA